MSSILYIYIPKYMCHYAYKLLNQHANKTNILF